MSHWNLENSCDVKTLPSCCKFFQHRIANTLNCKNSFSFTYNCKNTRVMCDDN